MSKYIKLEDAIDVASKECHEFRGIFSRIEDGMNALPIIEVSEDCISREYAIEVLSHVKKDEQWRTECIDNEIRLIKLLPSVVPSRAEGKWIAKDGVIYCSCCNNDSGLSEEDVDLYEIPLPNYCKDCGAKMKGADDE